MSGFTELMEDITKHESAVGNFELPVIGNREF